MVTISESDSTARDTAWVTVQFLGDNIVTLLLWSSHSPHLSPIDHVWDMTVVS